MHERAADSEGAWTWMRARGRKDRDSSVEGRVEVRRGRPDRTAMAVPVCSAPCISRARAAQSLDRIVTALISNGQRFVSESWSVGHVTWAPTPHFENVVRR